MPGLATSAVFAVSVMVAPVAGPSSMAHWSAKADATLASVVADWAAEVGRPAPVVDPSVREYRIGPLSLDANDYCAATARLVAALGHSATRPELVRCGSAEEPLVIAAKGGEEPFRR